MPSALKQHIHTHTYTNLTTSKQLLSHSRCRQHFMESGGSLPCTQEPTAGLYSKPDESSHPHPISPNSILILSSHLREDLLRSGFLTKTSHELLSSPCVLHDLPSSYTLTFF